MIPLLLWRCPLCGCNESLQQRRYWLRPDVLCTHCQARWRVRRVPGDNIYLKLVRAPAGSAAPGGVGTAQNIPQIGCERALPAWYDHLLAGLSLAPIEDPRLALEPGESLYLASKSAGLWGAAPGEAGQPAGAGLGRGRWDSGRWDSGRWSSGRLFLSNQRLAWRGSPQALDLPLATLKTYRAILTLGLAVSAGRELLFFRLPQESPLKWVTYLERLTPAGQPSHTPGSWVSPG